MSLYTKHRPKTFKAMFGNKNSIAVLTNLIAKENPPKVYLFTGPTGCGKTTLVRILAKKLGVDDMDYEEINSSNMRGIDTIRDLIKKSQYNALGGEFRFFMIDECHKLTNDAQNAMLKLLEDTPKHVFIALATTEPEKLIAAVKNRCQLIPVSLLTNDEMYSLLTKVIEKEGYADAIPEEAIQQIINNANGHARQAMQLLEQVLTVPEDQRQSIIALQQEEEGNAMELARALLKKAPWKSISKILQGLRNTEPETVRRIILGYMTTCVLNSVPNSEVVLENFLEPYYNTGFAGLVYSCKCCQQ